MSFVPGDSKTHDTDHLKGSTKSRIPSKLPMRQKQVTSKPKPHCETPVQISLRPKSANKSKDDGPGKFNNTRPIRGDRDRPPFKKQQKYGHYRELPDQETIQVREDLEVASSRVIEVLHSSKDKEPNYESEDENQIKVLWLKHTKEFETMKKDLDTRQRAIVELYANMRNTHQKLTKMGQEVTLPPSDELTIMNVAKLTPDQLLQLCTAHPARGANSKTNKNHREFAITPLTVDISKLYDLPTKIVATCEQTIMKRKEIIDWVTDLKSKEKGISRHTLDSKMHEFNAENEMLSNSLEQAKGDFRRNLEEIIEFMRKTMNEAIECHVQVEEQLCKMSELSAENADLRKQLHNNENVKSQKLRIEELETQLKEEKRTKATMQDQLARAGGQIKIGEDRAAQLETALEQAKLQSADLEHIIQQLQNQSQQLQANFDKELSKLTESVKENMLHLEEIVDARGKLEAEKDDLKKRLEDLSQYYNESLKCVKHDMNVNIAKLIETEKKFNDEVEEKNILLVKLETLQAQTVEYETRNKKLEIVLRELEGQLSKATKYEKELQSTKQELNETKRNLEDCKHQLAEQSETVKLLEADLEDYLRLEDTMKTNLMNKEEYISELEQRQSQLEKKLQDSENKMSSYEIQLSSLKNHIAQLQEDFGEFDNLEELHDMINQQRANLLETTRQNGELAQALQKKDEELDSHLERLAEQAHIIEQKEGYIKLLSEKEEEQTNIIKLLRTNLEMRTQADVDLSQQISEKNSEIEALIANVESRKQQISQLEAIILTLEEQNHKSILQRRKKDQDKIKLLEKQIAEYEAYHMDNKRDIPDKNLDSIIKILEEELGTPFDSQIITRSHEFMTLPKKMLIGDRRRQLPHTEYHKRNNQMTYQTENEMIPNKMVLDNTLLKTCVAKGAQFTFDNLDRKQAIMNIEKWATEPERGTDTYSSTPPVKDKAFTPFRGALFTAAHPFLTRNLPLLNTDQLRDDKKCKMFKLACHKL